MEAQVPQPLPNIREYEYLLVVDIEATCWESNEGRVHEMEAIEFGAVIVKTSTFEVLHKFTVYIKPQVHPILSDFCKQLTGATQELVDAGIGFQDLAARLEQELAPFKGSLAWASWGNYDKNQLAQDAARLHISMPLEHFTHINLKRLFAKKQRVRGTRPSVARAMDMKKLEFEGRRHNGSDEALNIVKLLPYVS